MLIRCITVQIHNLNCTATYYVKSFLQTFLGRHSCDFLLPFRSIPIVRMFFIHWRDFKLLCLLDEHYGLISGMNGRNLTCIACFQLISRLDIQESIFHLALQVYFFCTDGSIHGSLFYLFHSYRYTRSQRC